MGGRSAAFIVEEVSVGLRRMIEEGAERASARGASIVVFVREGKVVEMIDLEGCCQAGEARGHTNLR